MRKEKLSFKKIFSRNGLISLWLALSLLFTMLPISNLSVKAADVREGNVATNFAGGDGTEGNPYLISNAAELKYFAKMVNDSTVGPAAESDTNNVYVNTYFKLTADIYLNDESEYSTWSSTSAPSNNANKWTPIGAFDATGDYGVARNFGGVFDGDGYTIYGMYCSTEHEAGTGLFGSVKLGTIKNLTVENAYLTSTSRNIGGIVGYAYAPNLGIVIDNCGFSGNIFSSNATPRAGGIVGRAHVVGGTLTVSNCWSKGTVQSTAASGGLVGEVLGEANKELVINNCYTAMNFDAGTADSVAGLIGWAGNTKAFKVNISNCHVAGTSTTAYPLIGLNLRLRSAVVTLNNVYYVAGSYTGTAGNVATAGKITATNVAQKTADEFANGTVTDLLNSKIDLETAKFKWVKGESYPEIQRIATFAGGDGTEGNPYLISNAAELKYFAKMVNDSTVGPAAESNTNNVYVNTYFKLTADIYLNDESEYSTWSSTSAPSNNANKWTPIGAFDATGDYGVARNFGGVFDGDGYTIYGMYCSTEHKAGTGLFGSVKLGTIKNLTVENAYLTSTSRNIGGIVGYAYAPNLGIVIDNCGFSGNIFSSNATPRAGGIVGRAHVVGGTLTVSNCWSKGTVQSTAASGGLVGEVLGAADKELVINNCYTAMNFDAGTANSVAGLIGCAGNYNAFKVNISNCHVAGTSTTAYPLIGLNLRLRSAVVTLNNVYYVTGSYTGTADNVSTAGQIKATNVVQKTADEFADGTVTDLLNSTIDPETAKFEWVQGESYPEIQRIVIPDEDDNIATSFAGGDGTEGNPYLISNAAELKYFAKMVNDSTVGPAAESDTNNVYVNTYFKLTADIYLNDESEYSKWSSTSAPSKNANKWTPIGAATGNGEYGTERHFGGVFDGDGYTIYGMYCSTDTDSGTGLFGSVRRGTIKNLAVENAYLTSTSTYIGGIVGYAYAPRLGIVIDNCGFSGNIFSSNATPGAGGIVGRAHVVGGTLTVSNCWSKGTVQSTAASGGLVGEVLGAADKELVINNCYTAMNFDAGTEVNSVAGLIGCAGNYNAFKVNISNCHVAGTSTTAYPLIGLSLRLRSAVVTLNNVYYVTGSYTGTVDNVSTAGNITATNVAQKTADEFANGTVTGLLNSNIDINTDTFSWVQGTNYPELKARSNNINNDSSVSILDILDLRKYFIGKSDANISEDAKNFYDSRNNAVCDFVKFNDVITNTTVYLSDNGSDNNDGKTANSAVKTLAKAVELASTKATVVIVGTYSIKTTTWPTYDKQLTITGGTFDASGSANSFKINGPVTFDACTVKFKEGKTCYVLASGNKFVINENVTVEGMTNVFGGAFNYAVDRTDITVLSGNYYSICGAGIQATATVNGDTNVVVGGNVNSDIEDVCAENNRSADIRGAGINNSIVYGNTYVTIKDNVKSVQIFGGGSGGSRVYGKANINIEGGTHQSAYAGSAGSVIKNAELTLRGGTIDQIFGGSNGANMTGNTRINLLGGTVTRRVYGGCYNNYSFGWNSDYHVIGNITLYLSSNANFDRTSTQGDYGIFACSRYKTAFDDENAVIVYENEAAQEKFGSKLGQQDSSVSSIINPAPYDEIKIAE